MRKQELIHLHALLDTIRSHLDREGPLPNDAFDDYDAYGVSPMAIHRAKGDHHTAVQFLADGILATIDAREDTAETAQAEEQPPLQ